LLLLLLRCLQAGWLTTGDGAEALLPCRVPYLQLHPFVVKKNLFDLEVNPAPVARATWTSR
jgi:hypothetical protein